MKIISNFLKMFIFLVAVISMFLLTDNVKADTVVSGKYTYFGANGTVYKMNTKNGRVNKVINLHSKTKYLSDVFAVKGNWIYMYGIVTKDEVWYQGIYRIKKDGSEYEILDKGYIYSPQMEGKYIYYSKFDDVAKENKICKIKFNGKKQKYICNNVDASRYRIKIYKKRIYYYAADMNGVIYSVNLSGKKLKKSFSHEHLLGISEFYLYKNEIYLTAALNSDVNMYIRKQKLNSNKPSVVLTGNFISGYGNKIYYSNNYDKTDLYCYDISSKKIKKISIKMKTDTEKISNVIGGKKWIIVYTYNESDYYNRVYIMNTNGKKAWMFKSYM